MEIVVVGGSLSGLTFALACSRRGIRTRVLERVHGSLRGGGALGVDRDLLMRVISNDARQDIVSRAFPVVLAGRRRAVTWQALYNWLRGEALQRPEITLEEGVSVTEIAQHAERATAITTDGRRFEGCAIVGADGYRSFVRRVISPEQPDAMYAGYLLWRGLVDEASLPSIHRHFQDDGIALVSKAGYRLIAHPVAGSNGPLAPGQRLISFAWYDAGRYDLLRRLECINDAGGVLRSLSAEMIPHAVGDELCGLARRLWPDPWRSVLLYALENRQVFATPVAEFSPLRLCRGRLAIIGDAAHVVSPVTGKGFVHGMLDAEKLAECFANTVDGLGKGVVAALEMYENKRLSEVQTLVAASVAWGKAFLQRHPATFRSGQEVARQ